MNIIDIGSVAHFPLAWSWVNVTNETVGEQDFGKWFFFQIQPGRNDKEKTLV